MSSTKKGKVYGPISQALFFQGPSCSFWNGLEWYFWESTCVNCVINKVQGLFHKASLPVEALIPLVGFEILDPTREHGQTICWFLLTNQFHNIHLKKSQATDRCTEQIRANTWTSWWSQPLWIRMAFHSNWNPYAKQYRRLTCLIEINCLHSKYQNGSREWCLCCKKGDSSESCNNLRSLDDSRFMSFEAAPFRQLPQWKQVDLCAPS